jgi:hypothetical protein
MSEKVDLLVLAADAVIASIDAENAQIVRDWVSRTNGTYRNNKSREYRDYYNKRVFVLAWTPFEAIVQFDPFGPVRRIRRSHLIID